MAEKKKDKTLSYYICSVVGVAIMLGFWVIPPIDPITPVGMKCVGAFLGMVFLWSTVDTLWPSLLGLFMFGISGYGGEGAAGFKAVFLNAMGADTVILTVLAMILFGAMHEYGDTLYIARWLLTKKIYKGRPWMFLTMWFLCCAVVSILVGPIVGLIIMWPIALSVMATLNINRFDKIWPYFFVGTFLVLTLLQPFFPFKGAELIPISAFENMMANNGNPVKIPFAQYMFIDAFMTFLVMFVFMMLLKFLVRPDVSKLKAIDPAMVETQMQLPPMNFQQKAYLFMMVGYLAMLLIPGFIKGPAICKFLNVLGPLGVTVFWVVLFVAIKWNGKPLLDFKMVAAKQMNWGIYFMIASAVYGAGSLSNAATGVSPFLVKTLTPILGGHSETMFVALMFTIALIITNFANNAAMGVVLMPVIINFSNMYGINPMPVAVGVILMVFVAMLTPAASPHAGLMHGNKDIYSTGEILKIGLPMCIITLLLYVFVGYPIMKVLFAAAGAGVM